MGQRNTVARRRIGPDCRRRSLKTRLTEDQDLDIEILTLGAAQRGGQNWIELDQVGSGFRFAFCIESTLGSRLRAEPSARIRRSDTLVLFLPLGSWPQFHRRTRIIEPEVFILPSDLRIPPIECLLPGNRRVGPAFEPVRSESRGWVRACDRPSQISRLRLNDTIQNKTVFQYWHSGRGESAQSEFMGQFGTSVPDTVRMPLRGFQRLIGKNEWFYTRRE